MAGIVDVMRDASGALDYAIDALEAPSGASIRDTARELKDARGVVADMLAALESVIDDLVGGIQAAIDEGGSEAWIAEANGRLIAARAAIAKAKGEA
jgi:hypothetical protein